jgi:glycosyltransferase involved in cell wall biosynthesis
MNQKSPKVLVVINSITGGGAEDSAYKVYEELLARGINIRLCVLNRTQSDVIPLEVIALSRVWNAGLVATYRCFKDFKNLVEIEKPNILIAHCELPELFSAFLRNAELRIICVEHTTRPWHRRKPLGALVRIILKLKQAQWVTVTSTSPPIWFGAKKPICIANPVSHSISDSSHLSNAPLVFVGRIRKEKRPEWAIEAAIANKLQIDVYGDGQQLPLLKKKYSKNSTLVKFRGHIRKPWNEINPKALVIVSSEFEGDGLVVVESILNGNPILLLDNKDLRRFNLPNANYFDSQEDLNFKVSVAQKNKIPIFQPSQEIQIRIAEERNLQKIVTLWEKLLK